MPRRLIRKTKLKITAYTMKTKCKHVKILMTRKLIKGAHELNKLGVGKKTKVSQGKRQHSPQRQFSDVKEEGGRGEKRAVWGQLLKKSTQKHD